MPAELAGWFCAPSTEAALSTKALPVGGKPFCVGVPAIALVGWTGCNPEQCQITVGSGRASLKLRALQLDDIPEDLLLGVSRDLRSLNLCLGSLLGRFGAVGSPEDVADQAHLALPNHDIALVDEPKPLRVMLRHVGLFQNSPDRKDSTQYASGHPSPMPLWQDRYMNHLIL